MLCWRIHETSTSLSHVFSPSQRWASVGDQWHGFLFTMIIRGSWDDCMVITMVIVIVSLLWDYMGLSAWIICKSWDDEQIWGCLPSTVTSAGFRNHSQQGIHQDFSLLRCWKLFDTWPVLIIAFHQKMPYFLFLWHWGSQMVNQVSAVVTAL